MDLTCPACGANHEIKPGMISVVCEYCDTVSKIERDSLVDTWEKSAIMPFPTVFSVGSYFYAIENSNSNDKLFWESVEFLSDKDFYNRWLEDYIAKLYIYWQIRYTNEWWFWDDWFVRIVENKKDIEIQNDLVISEDEGLITVKKIKNIDDTEKYDPIFSKDIWESVDWYFIQETWIADVEWYKWSFPFIVDDSSKNKYVDLLKDSKMLTLKKLGHNTLLMEII